MILVRVRDGGSGAQWLDVVEANAAAADLFGGTTAELRATSLASEILAPLRVTLAGVQRTGAVADVDVRLTHPRLRGGAPTQVHGRAVKVEDEIALGLVDLTERDALYGRAALDDRLASLGRVAAGVAHEFNNPLAWVTAGVEQVRARLSEREGSRELVEILDEILQGTARLRRIVDDLRPSPAVAPDPEGSLVGDTTTAAARMAAHRVHGRGRLRTAIPPDLPRVIAEPAKLTQVLLNLIVNAAESLPDRAVGGGSIDVTAAHEGDAVVIRVVDDGCGIDERDLPRLFEPFYTTRTGQGGTGLGLWISRSIIESFGGTLELRSKKGSGTTAEVRLRVARAAPARARSRAAALSSRPPATSLRLLVVDDEPLVARAVARALRGHVVTVETSAHRALDRIRDGERFDAVLTDVTMPEMEGFELVLAAEMLDEDLVGRIFAMSGGTDTETWDALRAHGVETIEKPFDRRKLRGLFARVVPRER